MTSTTYLIKQIDPVSLLATNLFYTNTPWDAKLCIRSFAFDKLKELNSKYTISKPQKFPVYKQDKLPEERPIYGVLHDDLSPNPKGMEIYFFERGWFGDRKTLVSKWEFEMIYRWSPKILANIANSSVKINKQDYDPEIVIPENTNPNDYFKVELALKSKSIQLKRSRTTPSMITTTNSTGNIPTPPPLPNF